MKPHETRGPVVIFLRTVMMVLVVGVAGMASGCATIMHGTTQNIGISSTPDGAKVKINGKIRRRNTPHHRTQAQTELHHPSGEGRV